MQQINFSSNAELMEGATDGKVRKARPNTRVFDHEGHGQMMANRAGLDVPGKDSAYGALPVTASAPYGHGKVRPA